MNFNPPMCRAGKICIAEVEEVVDIDEIPPGQVNLMEISYLISTFYKKIDHISIILTFPLSNLIFTSIGPCSFDIRSKDITWTKLREANRTSHNHRSRSR